MRLVAAIGSILVALAPAGCKGQERPAEAAAAEPGAGEAGQAVSAAEKDLLARRDALLSARKEIEAKREQLAEKRAEIAATGGDTSEIDREASELETRETKLNDESEDVLIRFEELIDSQRATLAAAGGKGANLASREGALAAREKTLATREARLADRENALARREELLATKWKDSCVAGTPTTVIQTVDVKGSKYTKKDVEPLLKKARAAMSEKGILGSDLPGHASSLEKEATSAMAKGDYGRARFAADQLISTVKAMKIDKTFVSAKWARLNRAMKGQKLSGEQEQLLTEAAANIADGKFPSANRKLNKLYATAN